MSNKILSQAWNLRAETPTQKLVLIYLADRANADGVCYPSTRAIGEACGISRRTVQDRIKELESQGLLSVRRKRCVRNSYRIELDRAQLRLEFSESLRTSTTLRPPSTLNGSGERSTERSRRSLAERPQPSTNQNEREALQRFFNLMSKEERTAYGGNWRLRYRECADKFMRVLSDIEGALKEGAQILSVAAVADIRWREFQPVTKR